MFFLCNSNFIIKLHTLIHTTICIRIKRFINSHASWPKVKGPFKLLCINSSSSRSTQKTLIALHIKITAIKGDRLTKNFKKMSKKNQKQKKKLINEFNNLRFKKNLINSIHKQNITTSIKVTQCDYIKY